MSVYYFVKSFAFDYERQQRKKTMTKTYLIHSRISFDYFYSDKKKETSIRRNGKRLNVTLHSPSVKSQILNKRIQMKR